MHDTCENEAATGGPGPIQLGGQTYLASPPTDQDMATLHNYLRQKLTDPLHAIVDDLKGLPAHVQQMAIDSAVKLKAGGGAALTQPFIEKQLNEPHGCAFLAWLLIRKNHRDVKLEDIQPAITAENVDEVLTQLAEATGMSAAMPGKARGRTGSPNGG